MCDAYLKNVPGAMSLVGDNLFSVKRHEVFEGDKALGAEGLEGVDEVEAIFCGMKSRGLVSK
jgi:hypothetical protein